MVTFLGRYQGNMNLLKVPNLRRDGRAMQSCNNIRTEPTKEAWQRQRQNYKRYIKVRIKGTTCIIHTYANRKGSKK